MVQVINRGPSIGQLFGEGLGAGMSQTLQQRLQESRQKKQMEEGLARLDELGDVSDMDPLEVQKAIFRAFPGQPQVAQQMMGNYLQQKLMESKAQSSELQALRDLRKEERAERTEQRQIETAARQEAKFEKEMADDQADIDYVRENYGRDVNTGKAARTIIASKEKEMFEPTLQKGAAESILAYNKDIKDSARQAKKELPALKAARSANRKKISGLSDVGTMLYRMTGQQDFLSGDAALFNNAVKNLLGSARKDMVGGRMAQQEFFFIENLLPNLGKKPSANEALFNFLETTADMKMAEQQALNNYLKEIGGIQNAGPGFEAEVEMRADAIKDAIWEAYRPTLHGQKDLFEQAIEKDPSLKKKERVITPEGQIAFIDKSKVKKAKEQGYYIYGR